MVWIAKGCGVSKDQTFKLRLDEQDRERLDAIAAHLSAPAATAIRMLIKEKYDAIQQRESGRRRRAGA